MEIKLDEDGEYKSDDITYLVYIPNNFDITKFFHLIPNEFMEHTIKNEKIYLTDEGIVKTKESFYKSFKHAFDHFLQEGVIDSYNNYYYDVIAIILEELELVVFKSSPFLKCETGGMEAVMIDLSSKLVTDKVDQIKHGIWGIRHGGWGSES